MLWKGCMIEKDKRSADKLGDEIEKIEIDYSSAQNRYDKFLNRLQQQKDEQLSNGQESELPQLEAPKDIQPPQKESYNSSVLVSNTSQNKGSDAGLIGLDL